MARPFHDFDSDPLYGRDSRTRDLANEVFFDEFSARDRSYRAHERDFKSPYGPPDDLYSRHIDEVDARELINRGSSRFFEPGLDSPLPRRDRPLNLGPPLPMDPRDLPMPSDYSLPFDPPPLRDAPSEGKRYGSAIVYPPVEPILPKNKVDRAPSRTLYVGCLPSNITERHLSDIFSQFGVILYVRVKRLFAHIQFRLEDVPNLSNALKLDGHYVRIGPTNSTSDFSKIQVEFAASRLYDNESEATATRKSTETTKPLQYNTTNMSSLSSNLHKEETFTAAANSLKNWLEEGRCTNSTSSSFFGLIGSVNTCTRNMKTKLKEKEKAPEDFLKKHKEGLDDLDKDCKLLISVFQAASQKKARDSFTKAQRKSLSQWSDSTNELQEDISKAFKSCDPSFEGDVQPPPTKVRKTDQSIDENEEFQEMKRKLEQLKSEREVAVQAKDKQILQLRSLIAKFKKDCPSEWEKVTGEKISIQAETTLASTQEEKPDHPLTPTVKKDTSSILSGISETGLEVIEEVSMDDINTMEIEKQDDQETDKSLAAAAAAYAQLRSTIGSVSNEGLGLSESEVAIISVLATFLTVHPLGATINEITTYFQGFNPSYNSHYLESLLQRSSKVFQLSGESPGKWWFLGFQTCYAAVGEQQGKSEPSTSVPAEDQPTDTT